MKKAQTLFFIDSLGALLTFLSMAFVLPRFHSLIGLPVNVLYGFAFAALFLLIYSLTCFFARPTNWSKQLKIIAINNLIYCFVTCYFLVKYSQQLGSLAKIYFSLELLIIIVLATVEYRTALRSDRHSE